MAGFLSSYDRFTVPPLIVPIHDALGVSLGAAAGAATGYFVAYGVTQPAWGALSDRFGLVPILRVTVALAGIACVAAALVPTLALLIAARVAAGALFAAVVPAAITYIGDTVEIDTRQHALALMMASATLGTACATLISGVIAQVLDWRVAFLVPALIAIVVGWRVRLLVEPVRDPAAASFRSRLRGLLRHRWMPAVVGLAFLEGAVVLGALTFVAAALQESGVGAALAGSAVAGFGIANVACTPLVTRAIPRYPSPLLLALGAVFTAAGLLLAAAHLTVVTALVATLALGAGFGFAHSTLQVWATQVYPAARAVTISFFAAAVFTGGAVATLLASPLADEGRFSLLFLAAALGSLLLAALGPALRARWLVQEA
jgi:predicted MFS family arabinose efflux permease